MYSPCEIVTRYVLPAFRSFVAIELVEKYKYTQVEAAKKLGTTQAAISQYIHFKRGYRGTNQFKKALPRIHESAIETARRMALEKITPDEAMREFCNLCRKLQPSICLESLNPAN